MSKLRTHYDNLGVARNASSDVIRAAYKLLAKKYAPGMAFGVTSSLPQGKDYNNEEARRIIRIITDSYEALIDPRSRAEHDAWIESCEQKIREIQESVIAPSSIPIPPSDQTDSTHDLNQCMAASPTPGVKMSAGNSTSSWSTQAEAPEINMGTSASSGHRGDVFGTAATNFNFSRSSTAREHYRIKSKIEFPSLNFSQSRVPLVVVVSVIGLGIYIYSSNNSNISSPPFPTKGLIESGARGVPPALSSPSKYPACEGSYEKEKCEALEDKLARETPAEKAARAAALEASRAAAQQQLASEDESDRPSDIGENFYSVFVSKERAFGWAVGEKNQQDADEKALRKCRKSSSDGNFSECRRIIYGQSRCIVVGVISNGKVSAAAGTSLDEATRRLVSSCTSSASSARYHESCDIPIVGLACAY